MGLWAFGGNIKNVETIAEVGSRSDVFGAWRMGSGFDAPHQCGSLGSYGRRLYQPLRNFDQ